MIVFTSFFNPNGCPYRRANYHTFREALRKSGVTLHTTELAIGDRPFELAEADADKLVRARTGSLMFQKERMLNVLLDGLDPGEESVVWMDCDLVYLDRDWPKRVEAALEKNPVVQPYAYAVSLPKGRSKFIDDATLIYHDCYGSGMARRSFAFYRSRKTDDGRNLHRGHVGYVWAARRDFLERHRFYDPIVTGAGDLFMAMAFCGQFGWMDWLGDLKEYGAEAAEHFFDWGFPVADETGGEVGHTDDMILHLWHGDIGSRNYLHHSGALQREKFDPARDLTVNETGAWEWATEKPGLHASLKTVFDSQRAR